MKKFPLLKKISSLQFEEEDSYFNSKYQELHRSGDFENFFGGYEEVLAELDETSWDYILEQTQKLCTSKDKNGRWNVLFEKLNEVRGYAYLKSIGFQNIEFIPPSTRNGIESPDLLGFSDLSKVLCEVKTKHSSDVYMEAVNNSKVIETNEFLPPKLKELIEKTFNKACSQLTSYPNHTKYRKIIYLNIEYDNEAVDPVFKVKLNEQTRSLFESMSFDSIELAIHNEKK